MNLATPFIFASLGAAVLSMVNPTVSTLLGQVTPQAGLHISSSDVAVWLQSGGVVGVLVWVVKTQLTREKEQQDRYGELLKTHDKLHSQVAVMLQTTSVNMAALTEAIRAMKNEIRMSNMLRISSKESSTHQHPPVDDGPSTTEIKLDPPVV